MKLKVSSEIATLIQSGKDTRLGIASGKLQIKPEDLLNVLFFLSNDRDIEVRKTAQKKFTGIPDKTLDYALSSPDTDPKILDFICRLFPKDLSKIELILKNRSTDKQTIKRIIDKADKKTVALINSNISAIKNHSDLMELFIQNELKPISSTKTSDADSKKNSFLIKDPALGENKNKKEEDQKKNESVYKAILEMGISDKIKFAITGNKEARGILVKDPNKLVCGNVMKNPRITESEIILIAASKNVSTEVLRLVAKNKDWIKKYQIKFNLVTNPRVPLSISLNLLKHIRKKDLALISKSSNVPKALATMANNIIVKNRS